MGDCRQSDQDRKGRARARRREGLCRGAWARSLALALALLPISARAQTVDVLLPERECQVKYALLYSFGLFTTWPEPALPRDAKFVIGILGEKPFPEYLARIAEKKQIHDRRIEIHRFEMPDEIGPCHILYVTASVPPAVERAVVQKLADRQVLIVGEQPAEAGESGISIRFVIEQSSVRFELNTDSAKAHGLQFDARLLNLAKRPTPHTAP